MLKYELPGIPSKMSRWCSMPLSSSRFSRANRPLVAGCLKVGGVVAKIEHVLEFGDEILACLALPSRGWQSGGP